MLSVKRIARPDRTQLITGRMVEQPIRDRRLDLLFSPIYEPLIGHTDVCKHRGHWNRRRLSSASQ
jgi:hypothetical protein